MKHQSSSAVAFVSVLSLSLFGCSSSSPPSVADAAEDLGHASAPVIKGKSSDATQDAVVLLVHFDPKEGSVESCTGTLLSPRLVLTARHCVAATDEGAACNVDGTPIASGVVGATHAPSSLYVFTGPKRPDFSSTTLKADGTGLKILDDGGKNLCNHDIALVLLEKDIPNAKIAPIRLDGPVVKGEAFTAVGWGVTDQSPEPAVRQQRAGIKVAIVGPNDSGDQAVPPNEFQIGEAICSGDSGGPALASTGAVIGVVSRGGNGTPSDPSDPASSCVGTSAENIYTKVSPFKTFILSGYAAAGADPWYENGPDPRLTKDGEACAAAAECRSNSCLAADAAAPAVLTCATDCSEAACTDGLVCTAVGDAQVCRAPAAPKAAAPTTTTTKTSCGVAPGVRDDSGAFGAGALTLAALVIARRRRTAARA